MFASRTAEFSTPFLDLGLVPEAGSSLLLPRLIGHARAFELLVLGATFDAERARACGFVNDVVDAQTLETVALAAAARLAAKPPEALAMSRWLLKGDAASVKSQILEEGRLFEDRLRSGEAIEAFTAFLEKQPADFSKTRKA